MSGRGEIRARFFIRRKFRLLPKGRLILWAPVKMVFAPHDQLSQDQDRRKVLTNIEIVEIITRSTQGITRPFLCRGDDGKLYYVKGNGAGRRALISEWIAGNLGQRLGLPIPNFKLAHIPVDLINFSAREDIMDLGRGIAFASEFVENADELTYLFIEQLDLTIRAKILLFDWWTANADRTLTEHGGNPNILWLHSAQRPIVIDHNLALDETCLGEFWHYHIFSGVRYVWNEQFRQQMIGLMQNALSDLESYWRAMPEEWTEYEIGLTVEKAANLLWRFSNDPDKFWNAV